MVSSIVFLTEVPHHACALNIPICPTSTTMGSPGSFPGKPTKAPLSPVSRNPQGRRGTTADIGENLLPSLTVLGCSLTFVEVETGPLFDVIFLYFLLSSPPPIFSLVLCLVGPFYDIRGIVARAYVHVKLNDGVFPTDDALD